MLAVKVPKSRAKQFSQREKVVLRRFAEVLREFRALWRWFGAVLRGSDAVRRGFDGGQRGLDARRRRFIPSGEPSRSFDDGRASIYDLSYPPGGFTASNRSSGDSRSATTRSASAAIGRARATSPQRRVRSAPVNAPTR